MAKNNSTDATLVSCKASYYKIIINQKTFNSYKTI